jgi:hypothetical protein
MNRRESVYTTVRHSATRLESRDTRVSTHSVRSARCILFQMTNERVRSKFSGIGVALTTSLPFRLRCDHVWTEREPHARLPFRRIASGLERDGGLCAEQQRAMCPVRLNAKVDRTRARQGNPKRTLCSSTFTCSPSCAACGLVLRRVSMASFMSLGLVCSPARSRPQLRRFVV